MKCPADIAVRWARQWQDADLREGRLLGETVWPASVSIGRPTTAEVTSSWQKTADIIRLWRELRTGSVRWETIAYRATGAPVEVPVAWEISSTDEWIAAANERAIRTEYETLRNILSAADAIFHSTLIRERSLWKNKGADETVQATELAMQLSPGCAQGKPLRSLSFVGIDSKFFERHRSLIIRLLDIRFDGEVSRKGLETFLEAWNESDHWLLLADLGRASILSFPQLRVRANDLAVGTLAARALIVVENEKCLHLLPHDLPGVVAILGGGNNLAWLRSEWARQIPIAYWGDIDTWGLTLLAHARECAPTLDPLLMTREIFDAHSDSAVIEKVPASTVAPAKLTTAESSLYYHLLQQSRGRLEQEFLPAALVRSAINGWSTNTCR